MLLDSRIGSGRIFVAGASGLVGTNLLVRLRELGVDSRGSYFNQAPIESLKASCERFDFTRFEDCLAATKNSMAVVLCANSVASSAAMSKNPTSTQLPNLQITAGLLEACARNKVERVVLVSSSTVYQEVFHPISEDELDLNLQPFPLYRGVGWFHRYAEQLALHYHSLNSFTVGIIRPTALFGPHDHFEPGRSQVIPANIVRSLKKETPYVVWGDGHAVRDFHFVEDFIDDLIALLNNPCSGSPVNSASGTPRSIRQAVSAILKAAGHSADPIYDSSKPGAIPYRVLNTDKFTALFGPTTRTHFDTALEKTIHWYQSQMSVPI